MLKKLFALLVVVSFSFSSYANEENIVEEESAETAVEEQEITADKVLEVQENDFVLGDESAPVTIVEYASMSCGHCAHFHEETFDDLKLKYIDTGKVRFIFRDFPLDEKALRASMLARCAGEGDKERFLKFIKTLFKTQQNWAFKNNYLEILSNIAKLGGMSSEDFEACVQDKDIETQVMTSKFNATKFLEIRSTPSFYINGELHSGAKDIKYLSEAIDGLIKGVNANITIERDEGSAEEVPEAKDADNEE